jgi:hypothetical protein
VRNASFITALVVVGTIVIIWALGRITGRFHDRLADIRGVVTRAGLGVIFALVAAEDVAHGGFWLALLPFLLLVALWNFVVTAGIIWVWAHEEPSSTDTEASA